MNYYKHFLIYEGSHYSVCFHAETDNSSCVFNYYKGCDDITRASLLFLVKRMADTGTIYDIIKFRLEDKKNKIYAFKPKKERFFCFFFIEKTIIITSAYRKRKQKLDKRELQKAIQIRNQYIKGR